MILHRQRTLILAALLTLTGAILDPTPTSPADSSRLCTGNPDVVEPCFTIHGRLFVANGTPGIRIWRIGTRRILGVVPSEDEIMPEGLLDHLTFGSHVYGDFKVCPFTRAKPSEMQFVCIESASNLVVERHEPGKDKPVVYRLKGQLRNAP